METFTSIFIGMWIQVIYTTDFQNPDFVKRARNSSFVIITRHDC
jgi:hypothetical protein